MNVTRIDEPPHLLVEGEGVLDADWAARSMRVVTEHPLFDPALDVVLDLRAMSVGTMSPRGVGDLVELERSVAPERSGRIAIVTEADVAYAFSRMFEMLSEEREHRVFRAMEDALAWVSARA